MKEDEEDDPEITRVITVSDKRPDSYSVRDIVRRWNLIADIKQDWDWLHFGYSEHWQKTKKKKKSDSVLAQ